MVFFVTAAAILLLAAIAAYFVFRTPADGGYTLSRYEPAVGWTFTKGGQEITAGCLYDSQRFVTPAPGITIDLRGLEPVPGKFIFNNGACSALFPYVGRRTPLRLAGDKLYWRRGDKELGLIILQAGPQQPEPGVLQ